MISGGVLFDLALAALGLGRGDGLAAFAQDHLGRQADVAAHVDRHRLGDR